MCENVIQKQTVQCYHKQELKGKYCRGMQHVTLLEPRGGAWVLSLQKNAAGSWKEKSINVQILHMTGASL